MIDLIGVKKPGTFSELRARPRDWDLIRASPSRPAISKKCATKGRTKDRTRSRVHKFRKSLQTERHPQKKVRRRSTTHRQLPESQNKLSPYPRAHPAKAKKSLNFFPFLEGWLFTDLRRPAAHKFQKSTAYRDHHKLQTACDEQKSQKTGIFIARTFCAEVRSA